MCWPNEREERNYSRAELIMAESGESAPKTSELYLGIVDLFAVILPGAIFTSRAERLRCRVAPLTTSA
jgi:hypothetical protein